MPAQLAAIKQRALLMSAADVYPAHRFSMKKHWPFTHLLFGDRYKTFRFRATLVLYVLIVVLGSSPGKRGDVGRIALHGLAYSIITFPLFTGSNGRPNGKAIRAWLIVGIMGA